MKPMLLIVLMSLAGLGACGALVARHHARTSGRQPDRPSGPGAKLRQEEQRQRPWEGRN